MVLDLDSGVAVLLVFEAAFWDVELEFLIHPMRVFIDGEAIFATIELIAFETVAVLIREVVGGDVLEVEAELEGLLFAWLEDFGLIEGAEDFIGFLDLAFFIWGLEVDLDDVLTSDVTGVLDLDGDIHSPSVAIDGRAVFDVGIDDLLFEGGVGEAITEWVDDAFVAGIPLIARAFFLGFKIRVTGLIVAIVDVDAFFVGDVLGRLDAIEGASDDMMGFVFPSTGGGGIHRAAIGTEHRVVSIALAIDDVGLGVIREVLEGWILGEVTGPGIDGMSAWVDGAIEDASDGGRTGRAWGTHPNDAGDLVVFLEAVALEDVAGVDEDDDLVEFGLDHIKKGRFVFGEFEDVVGGVWVGWEGAILPVEVTAIDRLAVRAFLTATGDDHDGGVLVFLIGGFDAFWVSGERGLTDGGLGDALPTGVTASAATARGLFISIEFSEFGVKLITGFGQGLLEVIFDISASCAGAATTILEAGARFAKDGDLMDVFERKGVVLVLKKNHTLFADLDVEFMTSGDVFAFGWVIGDEPVEAPEVR